MGIRELRDNLTATIRRVRGGETITITHRDEPVAVLVPAARERLATLLRSGDVCAGEPLDHPPRRFPVVSGISASDALARDRDSR